MLLNTTLAPVLHHHVLLLVLLLVLLHALLRVLALLPQPYLLKVVVHFPTLHPHHVVCVGRVEQQRARVARSPAPTMPRPQPRPHAWGHCKGARPSSGEQQAHKLPKQLLGAFGNPVGCLVEVGHHAVNVTGDPQAVVGVQTDGAVVQGWVKPGRRGLGWPVWGHCCGQNHLGRFHAGAGKPLKATSVGAQLVREQLAQRGQA